MSSSKHERTPLLPSDHSRHHTLRARLASSIPSIPHPTTHSSSLQQSPSTLSTTLAHARLKTHTFLTSRIGHYSVLLLVSLDVACIFADFLISLYSCEHFCGAPTSGPAGRQAAEEQEKWNTAQEALAWVSVGFSCLFLLELLLSVWAFGRSFFRSKFHCFDALVIVVGFVLDVCLKGVLEEVGSIVVALRFWRVFKILEELGDAAEERMEKMDERVEELKRENEELKRSLEERDRGGGRMKGSSQAGDMDVMIMSSSR